MAPWHLSPANRCLRTGVGPFRCFGLRGGFFLSVAERRAEMGRRARIERYRRLVFQPLVETFPSVM